MQKIKMVMIKYKETDLSTTSLCKEVNRQVYFEKLTKKYNRYTSKLK